jgi:hypothetical protein
MPTGRGGVVVLLAVRAPTRQAAVFRNAQRGVRDIHLLDGTRRRRDRLQFVLTGGAECQAMVKGTGVEEFGGKQQTLRERMTGLAAGPALALAGGGRWLGRLDQVGGGRLGGGRGVLASTRQFLLHLGQLAMYLGQSGGENSNVSTLLHQLLL